MFFLSSLNPLVSSGAMGPMGLVPHDQNTPFPNVNYRATGFFAPGDSGLASATLHTPVRPIAPVQATGGPVLPSPNPTPITLPGNSGNPTPVGVRPTPVGPEPAGFGFYGGPQPIGIRPSGGPSYNHITKLV